MTITADTALPTLLSILEREEYHEHHERVHEVHKYALATSTGKGIDKLINSLRYRESEEHKKQRARITEALTPVATEMVKKYFRKVRKADGVVKKHEIPNEQRKEAIERNMSEFYARQSAEEYLFDTLEQYTFQDPNAFLVFEREDTRDDEGAVTGINVYPLVIPSYEVRHYQYNRGVLSWLLVERIHEGKERTHSEFFLYYPGGVLHVMEYHDLPPVDLIEQGYTPTSIAEPVQRVFVFRQFENGTREVPAIRMSAYLDGYTSNDTGVTPMEPARPMMNKLINLGSLHDLTVFLHSIPRRRELVEECEYEHHEYGVCQGGWLTESSTMCPACDGTGHKSITSEQDIIKVRLPQGFTADQIPDLARFAHTESADTAMLDWQQNSLDWLMKFIVYAVMTRDQVTMSEVSKTATELVLQNQDVYDTLKPYTALYSQAYMLLVRVAAQYHETEIEELEHHFPDDFQFETLETLVQKYREAKDAGLGYHVLMRLQAQIIRKQTRNMEEASRVMAWEKHKPFKSLPDEIVAGVILDRAPSDPDRLLYENFDKVVTIVEQETDGMFYRMPYDMQREQITRALEQVQESIQYNTSAPEPEFRLGVN